MKQFEDKEQAKGEREGQRERERGGDGSYEEDKSLSDFLSTQTNALKPPPS